jgi:hypothetical protein
MPFFVDPTPQPTSLRPPLWDRPSEALLGAPITGSALLARIEEHAITFEGCARGRGHAPGAQPRATISTTCWPAAGIARTATRCDADLLWAAASRAITMWEVDE